jgi:hypothetical protein
MNACVLALTTLLPTTLVEDVPNPTETALVPEEAQEAVSKRDMAEWTDGLQQESEETGFLDKGAEAPSLLFQLQKVPFI